MREPTIKNIQLYGIGFKDSELRLDWDNERHHAIKINSTRNVSAVAIALREAASLIEADPTLYKGGK